MSQDVEKLIWVPSPEEIEQERLWIKAKAEKIGLPALENLAVEAAKARELTYSPYSGYGVGAALLALSGNTHEGCNVERAGYSETDHSEEAAVTGVVIKGEVKRSGRKFIQALAVSHEGDTAPCGRCRQIIIENCDNALIVVADTDGKSAGLPQWAFYYPMLSLLATWELSKSQGGGYPTPRWM